MKSKTVTLKELYYCDKDRLLGEHYTECNYDDGTSTRIFIAPPDEVREWLVKAIKYHEGITGQSLLSDYDRAYSRGASVALKNFALTLKAHTNYNIETGEIVEVNNE